MYLENSEGTLVFVGSMNMGYISDTARNRAHNLSHINREPIQLGHNDDYETNRILSFFRSCLSSNDAPMKMTSTPMYTLVQILCVCLIALVHNTAAQGELSITFQLHSPVTNCFSDSTVTQQTRP